MGRFLPVLLLFLAFFGVEAQIARPGRVPSLETTRESNPRRHRGDTGAAEGRPTKYLQLKLRDKAEGRSAPAGRTGQLEKTAPVLTGVERRKRKQLGESRGSSRGGQQLDTEAVEKPQVPRKHGRTPSREASQEPGAGPPSPAISTVPVVRGNGYGSRPDSPGSARPPRAKGESVAKQSHTEQTTQRMSGQHSVHTASARQSRAEPRSRKEETHDTRGVRHSEKSTTPDNGGSNSVRSTSLPEVDETAGAGVPFQDRHMRSILDLGIPDPRVLADMLWQRRAAADNEKLKTASKKGETQENVFYTKLNRIKDHQWELRKRNEAQQRERMEMLESIVKLTRPLGPSDGMTASKRSTRHREGRKRNTDGVAGASITEGNSDYCRSTGTATRCRQSPPPGKNRRIRKPAPKPRKVSWPSMPSKTKQRLAAAALLDESDTEQDKAENRHHLSRRGSETNNSQGVGRGGAKQKNEQKELGATSSPRRSQVPDQNTRRRREQVANAAAAFFFQTVPDAVRAISGNLELPQTGDSELQSFSGDTDIAVGQVSGHNLVPAEGHHDGLAAEGPPETRSLYQQKTDAKEFPALPRAGGQERPSPALPGGSTREHLSDADQTGGSCTGQPKQRGQQADSFQKGRVRAQVLTGTASQVAGSDGSSFKLSRENSRNPANSTRPILLSASHLPPRRQDLSDTARAGLPANEPGGATDDIAEAYDARAFTPVLETGIQSNLLYERGASLPPADEMPLSERSLNTSGTEISTNRLRFRTFAVPTPNNIPRASKTEAIGSDIASATRSTAERRLLEGERKEARQFRSTKVGSAATASRASSVARQEQGGSSAARDNQQGKRRLQFSGKTVIDQATPARFEFVDNDHGMQFVNWRSFTGERVIEKFWENSLRESETRDKKRREQEVQAKFAEEFEFERRKKQLWEAMGHQPPEDNTTEQELADRYYSAMQAVLHGPKEDILTGQAFGRYALSSNDKFITDLRNRVIYGPWALNWNRAITSRTTRVSLGGRRGAVSVGSSAASYVTTANVNWNRTAVTFAVRPNDQAVKLGVLRGRYGVDVARSNRLRTSAVETVMRYVETATVVDQINRTYGQRIRVRRFSFNYTRDFTIPRFDSPGRTPGLRQELAVNWGSLGISVGTDVPDNEYAISVGLRGYQFSVLRDFFQRLTQFQGNWGRGWQLEIATKFEDPISQLIYYQVGFGRLGRLYATAGAGIGSEGTPMALVQVQGHDASVAFKAVEEAGVRVFNIGFTVGRFTYSWDSVVDYDRIALPLSPINAVLKTLLGVTP